MAAPHKSTTYKPYIQIPNPFNQGQDVAYGDILLDKTNELKWWRKFLGIGFLALFAISLVLFWQAISMQQVVPFLVNVMPTGEAAFLGEVRQSGELQVPEQAIVFQIRTFITNLRSISIDPQVLFNNIDGIYSKVTAAYAPILTNMLRNDSPFPLVGRIRRTVDIETIIRVTGNSYQVDWIESSIEHGGQPISRRMRGLVTIRLIPPTPDIVRNNPLGIFVDAFEFTEL